MPAKTLKRYSMNESAQRQFAKLSGDWNPVHMDRVQARRTRAGRPIVHGMRSVLSILETVAQSSKSLCDVSKIAAVFSAPIYVGDTVEVRSEETDHHVHAQAHAGGVAAADLRIECGVTRIRKKSISGMTTDDAMICRALSIADIAGSAGTVYPARRLVDVTRRYPNASRWLGSAAAMGLVCISRLVGMECPGRDSILSGFTVSVSDDLFEPALSYRVVNLNRQFRAVKLEVAGFGLRGYVEALATNPPTPQASMSELSAVVRHDEFAGQRALIVGGSRGLGELTAKIIASGGGLPVFTYALGKGDAERVAMEIREGGGQCEVLHYDVLSSAASQLRGLARPVATVYYYATPSIFERRGTEYDRLSFERFARFYVRGFEDLCLGLHKRQKSFTAFYPSSIAVKDNPPGLAEYREAKAAGEALCATLAHSLDSVRIVFERLPRLLTDQTAATIPTTFANTIETILPIVRKVQTFAR